MRNIFLTFSFIFISILSINSQEISNNTIGLRLGSNHGFGTEITYQKKLKETNRLEINLGLRNKFSKFKATGLYEWVWNLENNFNWYAGAGAGIYSLNSTELFASGVIGVEYKLEEIPLLISLDYRPELGIINGGTTKGLNSDLGLSLRYQF